MNRRQFHALVGGAILFPSVIGATEAPQRVRKVGVIMAVGKTPEYVAALEAFAAVLASLGWHAGSNLMIDEHWSAGDEKDARAAAAETVASHPDAVLAQSAAAVEALISATRTIPVVFVHVSDPVASGFVTSVARPDGNGTRITNIVPTKTSPVTGSTQGTGGGFEGSQKKSSAVRLGFGVEPASPRASGRGPPLLITAAICRRSICLGSKRRSALWEHSRMVASS